MSFMWHRGPGVGRRGREKENEKGAMGNKKRDMGKQRRYPSSSAQMSLAPVRSPSSTSFALSRHTREIQPTPATERCKPTPIPVPFLSPSLQPRTRTLIITRPRNIHRPTNPCNAFVRSIEHLPHCRKNHPAKALNREYRPYRSFRQLCASMPIPTDGAAGQLSGQLVNM